MLSTDMNTTNPVMLLTPEMVYWCARFLNDFCTMEGCPQRFINYIRLQRNSPTSIVTNKTKDIVSLYIMMVEVTPARFMEHKRHIEYVLDGTDISNLHQAFHHCYTLHELTKVEFVSGKVLLHFSLK